MLLAPSHQWLSCRFLQVSEVSQLVGSCIFASAASSGNQLLSSAAIHLVLSLQWSVQTEPIYPNSSLHPWCALPGLAGVSMQVALVTPAG
jgi:hypothetical protein